MLGPLLGAWEEAVGAVGDAKVQGSGWGGGTGGTQASAAVSRSGTVAAAGGEPGRKEQQAWEEQQQKGQQLLVKVLTGAVFSHVSDYWWGRGRGYGGGGLQERGGWGGAYLTHSDAWTCPAC